MTKVPDSPEDAKDSGTAQALGAYLMGMIASFENTRILDTKNLPFDPATLHPEEWYPFEYALALGELIDKTLLGSNSLLFWAGVKFMEIWYWHGPGKEIIFSSEDWVNANQGGVGYNSVVRGDLVAVGWTQGLEINFDEGYALIESVMPWSAEYQRGVLFGGFMLFDDLTFFNVEIVSTAFEDHLPFQRTIFKMTFKPKTEFTIDASSCEMEVDTVGRCKKYIDELLVHAQHRESLYSLREQYIQEMEALLKNSVAALKKTRNDLIVSNNQLSIEATTDSLTGLYNKRYFYQQIKQFCAIAKRRKYALYVIIVDIDYFKDFNDHYGHLEGDKVIAAVAECVKNVFKRGEDIACRFGGEEFVCVSLNEKESEIFDMAEKLKQEVLGKNIIHARSKVSDFLTISIGSTVGQANDMQIEKLLALADKALYKAKNQGRNRHIHI